MALKTCFIRKTDAKVSKSFSIYVADGPEESEEKSFRVLFICSAFNVIIPSSSDKTAPTEARN